MQANELWRQPTLWFNVTRDEGEKTEANTASCMIPFMQLSENLAWVTKIPSGKGSWSWLESLWWGFWRCSNVSVVRNIFSNNSLSCSFIVCALSQAMWYFVVTAKHFKVSILQKQTQRKKNKFARLLSIITGKKVHTDPSYSETSGHKPHLEK